jgi:hypothetical protein
VNWWDLDSLGQLWFAAENKIGGKYDDWECTKNFISLCSMFMHSTDFQMQKAF